MLGGFLVSAKGLHGEKLLRIHELAVRVLSAPWAILGGFLVSAKGLHREKLLRIHELRCQRTFHSMGPWA